MSGAPIVLRHLVLETQFRLPTSRSMTPCRPLDLGWPDLMEGLQVPGPPATVVTAVDRMTPSRLVAAPKHCPVVVRILQRSPLLNRVTPRHFRKTLGPEHRPLTRMETSTLSNPCVTALLDVRHRVTGLLLRRVRRTSMPPIHRRAREELFRRLFPTHARMNVWNIFRILMLLRAKNCSLLCEIMVRRTHPETPPNGMIL